MKWIDYEVQVFQTLILVALLVVVNLIVRKAASQALKNFQFGLQRRRVIVKIINFFVFLSAVVFLSAIWGVEASEIVIFVSSILTVLGVAFFAQWSVLSNITASLILFFNHPLKIGDRINVLDKEYNISGEIRDISFFFLHIKTDEGSTITIPNSVAIQKVISVSSMDKEAKKVADGSVTHPDL